jgi:hypothetical protein
MTRLSRADLIERFACSNSPKSMKSRHLSDLFDTCITSDKYLEINSSNSNVRSFSGLQNVEGKYFHGFRGSFLKFVLDF